MAKLTIHDVAEAAADAIRALHGAVGQGDHSPVVDDAVAKLTPPEETTEDDKPAEDSE